MSTSELFYVGWSSILTCSYTFIVDDIWELHVQSPTFDQECAAYFKRIAKGPPSDDSDSYNSDDNSLLEDSSLSRYDVSKLEAYLYYFGIRGPRRRGPKLIFRTSKDVFVAPSGPEQNSRLIQSTSTKNLAQPICGLLFVLRFMIFSKCSSVDWHPFQGCGTPRSARHPAFVRRPRSFQLGWG